MLFFGLTMLLSTGVALASYAPPAINPDFDSNTQYVCYSQANGVSAAWSIIYKKADFSSCGSIPAGIDFHPTYGIKVGCGHDGSNISGGGSYDQYSYYSGSWHKDDWSGYGALNNSNSLDSQVACSVDLPASYPGFSFQGSYYSYGQTIMSTNYTPPTFQLSVTINPANTGSVASSPTGLDCTSNPCTGTLSQGNVQLTPAPITNYAFGYWDDGTMQSSSNPMSVKLNDNKALTAKFFKTFSNRVGNFQITTGDECVIYVRNETGIISAACNGEAADCFSQAQTAGYATGQTPKEGTIIVFDRVPETALSVGHVAIVTSYSGNQVSMHDSNWVGYHTIGNHTETIGTGGYAIKGYIYYTPNQP